LAGGLKALNKMVWSVKRLPIRGGNWNNGSNAGVFSLNLNNLRSNVNNNIGFRVALIISLIFKPKGLKLCIKTKGDLDLTEKTGKNISYLNTISN